MQKFSVAESMKLCKYYYYIGGRRSRGTYYCQQTFVCCNKRECCDPGPPLSVGIYDLWYFWLCIVFFIIIITAALISLINRKYRARLFRIHPITQQNAAHQTVTVTASTTYQGSAVGGPPPYTAGQPQAYYSRMPPPYHEAVQHPGWPKFPAQSHPSATRPDVVYSTTFPPLREQHSYPTVSTSHM